MVGPLLEEREKWRTPSCTVRVFREHPAHFRLMCSLPVIPVKKPESMAAA